MGPENQSSNIDSNVDIEEGQGMQAESKRHMGIIVHIAKYEASGSHHSPQYHTFDSNQGLLKKNRAQ